MPNAPGARWRGTSSKRRLTDSGKPARSLIRAVMPTSRSCRNRTSLSSCAAPETGPWRLPPAPGTVRDCTVPVGPGSARNARCRAQGRTEGGLRRSQCACGRGEDLAAAVQAAASAVWSVPPVPDRLFRAASGRASARPTLPEGASLVLPGLARFNGGLSSCMVCKGPHRGLL